MSKSFCNGLLPFNRSSVQPRFLRKSKTGESHQNRLGLVTMGWAALWFSAASNVAQAATEGYYPLTVGFGTYTRSDSFTGQYDGLPGSEITTIRLDDSALNTESNGYLVFLPSGQVTGHWVQMLNFTSTWSGKDWHNVYSGIAAPEVALTVDLTGTVISETPTAVTLQLNATINCDYRKENTFTSGVNYGRFGPDQALWNAAGIVVPMTVTAVRNPDGSLALPVPTIAQILPALANASPVPPSGGFGPGTEIRNLAWPASSGAFDYLNPHIPGVALLAYWYYFSIGDYKGGPTIFNFAPPQNELRPEFEEYYLLDVDAPFGFIATGTLGDAVRFRYGSETLEKSMASGFALAPFDYGTADTSISADFLTGGVVATTLTRPLTKVPVPPWGGDPSDWSTAPGVIYSRSLNWPVSLATSRSLENASFLTGIWGITGSAQSDLEVRASSVGTPTEGLLEGKLNFKAAGRDIGFTLGGSHLATLNASGLGFAGNCETSPLTIPLYNANLTPLSLVPGLTTAVSSVHPFFRRLINGSGIGVRSELGFSAAGEYAALAADANPHFTSGSIIGSVDVSARLNVLPEMMRDILYLGVEGGGGLEAQIQLTPPVEMTSLGGHLFFTATAAFFGLEAIATKDYEFGDFAPASAQAALRAVGRSSLMRAQSANSAAAPMSAPVIPAPELLPARSNIAVSMPVGSSTFVVSSVPTAGQPSPASRVTLRYRRSPFQSWEQHSLGGSGSNLAPTIGGNNISQAIIWSQNTAPAPTAASSASEREAFANGFELQFVRLRERASTLEFPASFAMTGNALCDFGASIAQSSTQQIGGTEPLRVFWARSNGTDFTGSTTPLVLLSRQWVNNLASNLADGWGPEVTVVSGLSNIVDWKAIVSNATNAAIVLTIDTDGDLATVNDTELWLARETNGVWAAPIRLTDNAVADEQPVMFYADSALRLAWRQDGAVVYLPDVFTGITTQTLLPASYDVGAGFAKAWFGTDPEGGTGLFLVWPDGDDVACTLEGRDTPLPGALLAAPRYLPVGDDTITGFKASKRSPLGFETITLAVAATPGSPTSVPVNTEARLAQSFFYFIEGTPDIPVNFGEVTLAAGEEISFSAQVEEAPGTSYQWLHNGVPVPGANSSIYHRAAATAADAGTYILRIASPGKSRDYSAATVTITESFDAWKTRQGLVEPFDTRSADADMDGAPNDLEYLFGTDPKSPSSRPETNFQVAPSDPFINFPHNTFTFQVSASATDCDFAIEHSHDFVTWVDVRYRVYETSEGYGFTDSSSPDGLTRGYYVFLENENGSGPFTYPALDWTRGFTRVRMIRP